MKAQAGPVSEASAVADSRRSLVAEMLRGYAKPGATMQQQIAMGLAEGRALLHLLLGCGLLCVASIPGALEAAADLPVDDAVSAAVSSRIFGYLIIVPILAYAFTFPLKLVLGGSGLAIRTAFFWSVLLGGPIALLLSAMATAAPILPEGTLDFLSSFGFLGWLWLLAGNLGAASNARPVRIFVVLGGAFALLVIGFEVAA